MFTAEGSIYFGRQSSVGVAICQLWCMLSSEMNEASQELLGRRLRDVRELRGWSLHTAARQARVSPAYVQKLERGQVVAPSPHKLRALSEAYGVGYEELMRLAGYALPERELAGDAAPSQVLAQAMLAEDLTEEEIEDLASYLRWRREQRSRS